ncbi:LAQU0S13e01002g1_1 [Lachancea quebecensis]|uniref:LAQU0S13e01002g1_1 n=1 Tax=Lachancea quebecensis TaxID=1654605 RepID=A0A0N7MM36_9SACH|nr:LAQU0S13e01002g1_1 [Lachancea quebecensis]
MNEYRRVTREELFDNSTEEPLPTEEKPSIEPDLEFITVNDVQANDSKCGDNTEGAEEFEFPLFSFGVMEDSVGHNSEKDDVKESRGRTSTRLMKVSLRESSPDFVKQERPRSFYFAEYSAEQVENFEIAAIKPENVLQERAAGPYLGWPQFRGRLWDLDSYNAKIERERLRELRIKRRRPGKKQRLARKAGSERVKGRLEKAKEIKKLAKKKFHKRGGKKNKKMEGEGPSKPKFRKE